MAGDDDDSHGIEFSDAELYELATNLTRHCLVIKHFELFKNLLIDELYNIIFMEGKDYIANIINKIKKIDPRMVDEKIDFEFQYEYGFLDKLILLLSFDNMEIFQLFTDRIYRKVEKTIADFIKSKLILEKSKERAIIQDVDQEASVDVSHRTRIEELFEAAQKAKTNELEAQMMAAQMEMMKELRKN